MAASATETTYIMIKPDGVMRGLVGEIISRFERKGLKLVGMKFMQPTKAMLEEHYADLASKSFFPGLIAYMLSGPVVAMAWQGKNAAAVGRQLLGATRPADSAPGTIRFDFAMDVGRNLVHGSDSPASAEKELKLWFPEGLATWKSPITEWVFE